MRELNLEAPAMLEKSIVRKVRHGEFEVLCHRLAYRGTLLRCLHQYELKPAAQKFLYSILVNEKARIEWREIDEIIAQRLKITLPRLAVAGDDDGQRPVDPLAHDHHACSV